MASFTDAYENELLDMILIDDGNYLALFTADPTDTGSVANEVTGGSYARKSLSGLFTAASGTSGASSNTSAITFITASADWGTITHIGVVKSGTGSTDDMILHASLLNSVTIGSGEVFEMAIGDLTLTLA